MSRKHFAGRRDALRATEQPIDTGADRSHDILKVANAAGEAVNPRQP
jgi:hypothetical protein